MKQPRHLMIVLALLMITLLACSISGSPTKAPPITQIVEITHIVRVPVTQIVPITQTAPVTQMGPSDRQGIQATFLGQDGGSYAGQLCEAGTASDNIHIHIDGLKTDSQPIGYAVQERSGGGSWASPCNTVSNWLLYVITPSASQAELYFKPYRNAPDNTQYVITIQYEDGTQEHVSVIGSQVTIVLSASFLGQDGGSFAGRLCATGTTNDNVHIHLNGLRIDQPTAIKVEDRQGGGVWATPCDPVSNWLLYYTSKSSNQADIYIKPFRDAPDNTMYTITVRYSDGWTQTVSVVGWRVQP